MRAIVGAECRPNKSEASLIRVSHRAAPLVRKWARNSAARWREGYAIAGVEALDLHHLHRAVAWLCEELTAKDQGGGTPFSREGDLHSAATYGQAAAARRATWVSLTA
jgi:hypothetical protein